MHYLRTKTSYGILYAVKVGSGYGVALGKLSMLASPTVRCKADTYIQQQGPMYKGKCVTFNQ